MIVTKSTHEINMFCFSFLVERKLLHQWIKSFTYTMIRSLISRVKGALSAQVIRLRVFYNQNDETLSRNLLMYMRKANLPIAVH